MRKCVLFLLLFSISQFGFGQLKNGFDAEEYAELMKMSAKFGDSTYRASIPSPQQASFIYRSPVVGLDNCWDLWIMQDTIAVISIRGTTAKPESWLANFYSAMVPAKGTLTLTNYYKFQYALAQNPKAAIHTGWLISTGFLAPTVLQKIDSCYRSGIKNYIIFGHSQGGAIGYLLSAHLYSLQNQGRLPADISFKSLLSASPKPGNLYFGYDYEFLTRNGRSFNIVNAADWVPESPFSVQTIDDLNNTNPFKDANKIIRKQKFPKNLVLKYAYNKLDKPGKKTRRLNKKFLGKYVAKMIRKSLPEFVEPDYYNSFDYVRVGQTIVLNPDSAYYAIYPDDSAKIFVHHYHTPYLYLLAKQYQMKNNSLTGDWVLTFLSGRKIALNGLFPNQIPTISMVESTKTISGINGCNRINGQFTLEGNLLRFDKPIATTKMFCNGEGEQVFMETLSTINIYIINSNGDLELLKGKDLQMVFKKKP